MKELTLSDVYLELGFLVFIMAYLVNMYTGSQQNESIAKAWAKHFAMEGKLLHRNFSNVGLGEWDLSFLA